jgi:hypothetical protein
MALAGYARHKLALLGVWEMPFFSSSTGLTRTLLGGWQLAGSAIFQTGNPINVTRGGAFPSGDFNADGNGGDRPNAPASTVKQSGWSQEEYLAGSSRWPTSGAGGWAERRLVRNAFAAPYADVNLSPEEVQRHGRVNAPRVDAFNAFNRVNLLDRTWI